MKPVVLLLLAVPFCAWAEPRTSSNYTIHTETVDSGGHQTASSNYSQDASLGVIAGIASVGSPPAIAKAGYVGQLYEITGLQISSWPQSNVPEGWTIQLAGDLTLDDETLIHILRDSEEIAWSVLSGPVSEIDNFGFASTTGVYQDTIASIRGSYEGTDGFLNLTILNTGDDDFKSYGGDGLDDLWQVTYFGEDNPEADPLADPDHDTQNNHFEFLAGLLPDDPNSRFQLWIEPQDGGSAMRISFSPWLSDRVYAVLTSISMNPGSWSELEGSTPDVNGNICTVVDPEIGEPKKFYRVQIVKP